MNNEHSSNQNHIAMIRAELQKVDSFATDIPKQIGMLTVKTANQTIKDAALRPNPDALWLSLWYEVRYVVYSLIPIWENLSMPYRLAQL